MTHVQAQLGAQTASIHAAIPSGWACSHISCPRVRTRDVPARPVGHRRCGAGAAFRANRNACGRCQRRRMKAAEQVCERGEAQPRSARPPGGPSWCPLLLAHQPDVRRPSAYRSGDRRSQTWGLSRCESLRVVPQSRLLGEAQTWGAKVVRELLADLLRGLLAGHPLCSLK